MRNAKLLMAIGATVAALTNAYAAEGHAQHMQVAGTSEGAMVMTAGQVRKVDVEQGRITIQHEAISNLDMPAMTMVFRTDKSLLAGVKAGDKVAFHAENRDGALAVTHIERLD